MATPVIMPRQGQSVESCILTEWQVSPGDVVEEGTVLAVIETDKASFDLESTAAGTVLELFWEADDDVPVLANVLASGAAAEDADAAAVLAAAKAAKTGKLDPPPRVRGGVAETLRVGEQCSRHHEPPKYMYFLNNYKNSCIFLTLFLRICVFCNFLLIIIRISVFS